MCTKIAHKTTWGAAQAIVSLKKSGKIRKTKKMGGYWCEECQAYHITTRIGKDCEFKTT